MFSIDPANLPVLPTCQALLVLDMQNDLLSPGCPLPLQGSTLLVERTKALIGEFRKGGKIIWVYSQFEENRPINDGTAESENVITDAELPAGCDASKASSSRFREMLQSIEIETEDSEEEEELEGSETEKKVVHRDTFLTTVDGVKPSLMLPLTSGLNFSSDLMSCLDTGRDIIFNKSHYSAFRSGDLLQSLRRQFVTELYICGAITNTSVYATALDGAQFGYRMTLVSDCLGYVSQARHTEALRRLVRETGCTQRTSASVIEIKKSQEPPSRKPSSLRREVPGQDSQRLREVIGSLRSLPRSRSQMSQSSPSGASSSPSDPVVIEADSCSGSSGGSSAQRSPYPDIPGKSSTSGPATNQGYFTKPRNFLASRTSHVDFDDDSKAHESTTPILGANDDSSRTPHKSVNHELLRRSSSRIKPRMRQRPRPEIINSNTDPSSAHYTMAVQEASEASQEQPIDTMLSTATNILQKLSLANQSTLETEVIGTSMEDDEYKVRDPDIEKSPKSGQHQESTTTTNMLCEGDTEVIQDILEAASAEAIFIRVRDEVGWQTMHHLGGEVPRLVAVQCDETADGDIPVYRHPADESPSMLPFSSAVSEIKLEVEEILGHEVNHCLIQFYRDGTDYISEHSDKTLDIAPDSYIANVSLGATRTMIFRTKRDALQPSSGAKDLGSRRIERALLPHNSLCKVGLRTNQKWLHAIRADKRRLVEKTPEEQSYNGQRISLTFRRIATFLTPTRTEIYGQGAVSKYRDTASPILNGPSEEGTAMVHAFGLENRTSDFDWNAVYGGGFDVLHMTNDRRLFLDPASPHSNTLIQLMLHEYGLGFEKQMVCPPFLLKTGEACSSPQDIETSHVPTTLPMRLTDNDTAHSEVEGDVAITIYLETFYCPASSLCEEGVNTKMMIARRCSRMQEACTLARMWSARNTDDILGGAAFRKALRVWDGYAVQGQKKGEYIADRQVGLADFAFWALLEDVVRVVGWDSLREEFRGLRVYWDMMGKREGVRKMVAELVKEREGHDGV